MIVTADNDTHLPLSLLDLPFRTVVDSLVIPPPNTVTITAPVFARFEPIAPITDPTALADPSIVIAFVIVLLVVALQTNTSEVPDDTTTLPICPMVVATLVFEVIEVDDLQLPNGPTLRPMRQLNVRAANPPPTEMIVTCALPVIAVFDGYTLANVG